MAHVAQWKKDEVDLLNGLIREYPVVGVVNMENMPAKQLQKMRTLLRGDVVIKMSRKSMMQLAIEKASKEERGINALSEHVSGQPAFIFSKMNPFKLNKILQKNRTTAPAKPESIAPVDITVKKGATSFPPGPLLGELQMVGIPASIEKGKIVIKSDKTVVKKGERVSANLAMAISRLGIEPIEIGINLMSVYEGGTVFLPDVLSIDEVKVMEDIMLAYQQALNLSIDAGYIVEENADVMISKAFRDAKALALEAVIFEKDVMDQILAKAYSQMLSVTLSLTDDALDEDLKDRLATTAAKAERKPEKTEEEKNKDKNEEEKEVKTEEKSEEEAIQGLGSLFG